MVRIRLPEDHAWRHDGVKVPVFGGQCGARKWWNATKAAFPNLACVYIRLTVCEDSKTHDAKGKTEGMRAWEEKATAGMAGVSRHVELKSEYKVVAGPKTPKLLAQLNSLRYMNDL
jgi:hypothetical protein